MSEQQHRWGENMWWPAQGTDHHHNQLQQQQQQQQQHQMLQQQHDVANSGSQPTNHQQMFSYKMAGSGGGGGGVGVCGFQENNAATTAVTAANYDYRLGGNQGVAQTQWWYPPTSMDNMHQQNLQTPVHNTPNNPQTDIRQQHQEELQRHHQQQEAHQRHQQQQQALAEAQARHQQQQQQLHQQYQQQLQQHHQQNNHQHHQLQQHHQQQQPLQHLVTSNKGRMPRAKADARPRGRMTAYAFFVQTCREEHKKKHPDENVVFAEFSKKCAERWKTMLDKEKKRFHEMAENDKKRYDDEMKNYTPPKGEKQRGKKRKQVKDPNAPKRSLSAFFWFSNDERGKVKGQNPQYGVGDIAKELGRRWADAEPETKSKYEALADKDKARYEKEMTAYKKSTLQAQQQALSVPDNEEAEDDDEEVEEDEDD